MTISCFDHLYYTIHDLFNNKPGTYSMLSANMINDFSYKDFLNHKVYEKDGKKYEKPTFLFFINRIY